MALILTVLMGLAGAGVDYGLVVINSARLQNALDAAALAGARALVTTVGNTAAQEAAAATAITASLAANGYTDAQNGLTVTPSYSSSDGSSWRDTATVNGTLALPTRFWRVVGFDTMTIQHRAVAAAGGGMVDVMLSLDLSGSMERSGTDDLGQLRGAVVEFINQMQVDPTNVRGTQLGIARWAGIKCSWYRSWSGNPSYDYGADGDRYIDQDQGPHGSEYVTPCTDDKTVVTGLTNNRNTLIKIADGSGPGTCPPGMSDVACPLQSWKYTSPPVVYGTPTVPLGLQDNSGYTTRTPASSGGSWYQATGTRIANSMTVTKNGGYCAWSSANGGRNGEPDRGFARKVLVIMTDGKDESAQIGIPDDFSPSISNWDTDAENQAAALKLGCDGLPNTGDEIEIYVVGFFCTPYSGSSAWCLSRLADTAQPHKCPGPTWPTASPSPSTLDTLLRNISSSSPGTCDHYFPIKKTEDLPQLFRVMAGSIARGRLQ